MSTYRTDEKKTARGGLVGRHIDLLASQKFDKIVLGGSHARLALKAACLRPQRCFAVKVAVACLAIVIHGTCHAAAAPSATQGQNGVDIGLLQRAALLVGDGGGNPAEFTDAPVSVIAEDVESVSKEGSKQKGAKPDNDSIGVEPEKNFFNQHGILWALICFVAGVWNGGGFQSFRRKDENL